MNNVNSSGQLLLALHVPVVLTSMSNIHWSFRFRAFLCPLSIVIAMERYVHF